jgi:hypothetical protein
MELSLQFGSGMIAHSKQLVEDWGGGGVILSPRDLDESQLITTSNSLLKIKGIPYIDPQCYDRTSSHDRLNSHEYWTCFRDTSTGAFLQGQAANNFLERLRGLILKCEIREIILPSVLASEINDAWFYYQEKIISEASKYFPNKKLYMTIALSESVLNAEESIEAVVDRAAKWNVDGFYVVAEAPAAYLIEDINWLSNYLILCSGLKLLNKTVVAGYSNHQMLCLATANVDVIASGNWLNVRAFPIEKFDKRDEDKQSRRKTWYYCPNSLSEYKVNMLDAAKKLGILDELRPSDQKMMKYCQPLFSGLQPTTVGWGESFAFRHYLACLQRQVLESKKNSFQETFDGYFRLLDEAEKKNKFLRSNTIAGQDRDFAEYFDINRSALAILKKVRGPQLKRFWT